MQIWNEKTNPPARHHADWEPRRPVAVDSAWFASSPPLSEVKDITAVHWTQARGGVRPEEHQIPGGVDGRARQLIFKIELAS